MIFDVGTNVGSFFKDLSDYFPKSKFYCFKSFPKSFEKITSNLPGEIFQLYQLSFGDQWGVILVNDNGLTNSETSSFITNKIVVSDKHCVSVQIHTVDEF
ncbi:hypothetical protein [Algoriphagus sp.]|uniref:hypothetical protein n=1 Tax=Algoriphagus sp. TaxID=1872435 RepID=UPI0026372C03|nr:hypothetical protein [Algoriphagus sp.]